eukprot:TRINITY_DN261_c0_g1_i2.p1 TRINITY_DN261_c0_g1~~TRINITY_DN261_c0_g1_i2.p1  ORF type:complete len:577 (+),score=187.65 TRINITY_DN261_c0_g1_i2:72-1733(+)
MALSARAGTFALPLVDFECSSRCSDHPPECHTPQLRGRPFGPDTESQAGEPAEAVVAVAAEGGLAALDSLRALRPQDAAALADSGCAPLHAAAGSGRVAAMQALLDGGADPSAVDQDGATALHLVLRFPWVTPFLEDPDGADLLRALAAPAALAAADSRGRYCMHVAAAHGRVQAVRLLLSLGADAAVVAEEERSAREKRDAAARALRNADTEMAAVAAVRDAAQGKGVYSATPESREERAARIAKEAATQMQLDAARSRLAAAEETLQAAEELTAAALGVAAARGGSSAVPPDAAGDTAVHLAAANAAFDVEPGLLQFERLCRPPGAVHAVNAMGQSALHAALRGARLHCATVLLRRGADPLLRCALGRVPLHCAAEGGCDALADLGWRDTLYELARPAASAAVDADGDTPLHAACRLGRARLVTAVCGVPGCKREVRCADGSTPLLLAAACPAFDDDTDGAAAVRALASRGALQSRSEAGETALRVALRLRRTTLTCVLLAAMEQDRLLQIRERRYRGKPPPVLAEVVTKAVQQPPADADLLSLSRRTAVA